MSILLAAVRVEPTNTIVAVLVVLAVAVTGVLGQPQTYQLLLEPLTLVVVVVVAESLLEYLSRVLPVGQVL
jgi:hypothetical protein